MDIAERLVLDRSAGSPKRHRCSSQSEAPCTDRGHFAEARSGSWRGWPRLLAVGFAWRLFLSRTDPDRLWVEAETGFPCRPLGSRPSLVETARAGPAEDRPGLDARSPARHRRRAARSRLSPHSHGFPRITRSPPRGTCWPAGSGDEQHCLRKAEAELRRALQLKPGLIEAHKELIYILGIQSRRREVDAEFHALAQLTPLTHHDLFTWALTHFTHWSPDIVEDLDGFIKADPEDRYSRLAVVELLLERPGEEVDSYIERILEPLPDDRPRCPGPADRVRLQSRPRRGGRTTAGTAHRRITPGLAGSAAKSHSAATISTRRSGISRTR